MKFSVKSESLAEPRQAAEMGPRQRSPEKPERNRGGRQPLPKQLPGVEHRHEPETCTCGQCGQALVPIGEDVTEKLSIVPAEFFVERHIYPKYADHLPPYRLERQAARSGVTLSRSTLADWGRPYRSHLGAALAAPRRTAPPGHSVTCR